MNAEILHREFDRGLPFREFVATADTQEHQARWVERYERMALDAAPAALVGSFSRAMNVLCLTGPWCSDCALQGAAMARVADANAERIHLRFIPRSEEYADLIVKNMINGGYRVPVTWFMAEDFEPVSRYGDRTLSRYRSMARKALGEQSNVLAPPPADPVREVLREVLDEFERVQLLLRLSPRLRQKHED